MAHFEVGPYSQPNFPPVRTAVNVGEGKEQSEEGASPLFLPPPPRPLHIPLNYS